MLAASVNHVYTAKMAEKHEDPTMAKVRAWFEASGLTLHDLGLKMGYGPELARQSAWQFMKSGDPRISMLRRFAVAAGMPLAELIGERKGRKSKTTISSGEGSHMTIYLKEHDLSAEDFRRFESELKPHGATLAAIKDPVRGRIRLFPPVEEDVLRVVVPEDKAAAVEHVCQQFGFIRTTPPKPTAARMDTP